MAPSSIYYVPISKEALVQKVKFFNIKMRKI